MERARKPSELPRKIAGWIAVLATPLAIVLTFVVFFVPGGTYRWDPGWVLVDGQSIQFVDRDWQSQVRYSTSLWMFLLWLPAFLWLCAFVGLVGNGKAMSKYKSEMSRKGICWNCDYDLRGTREQRCPECGRLNVRGDVLREEAAARLEENGGNMRNDEY